MSDPPLRIGEQNGRAIRVAQHQRARRRVGHQDVAVWPRLGVGLDDGDAAPMDLIRRKQVFCTCANSQANAPNVLVDVCPRVADRIADVQRLAATLAHPA